MAEPVDNSKDLTGADLDGFARRIAYQAIDAATAANPAARYVSRLFQDAIIAEARSMLARVVLHERQRAGRVWPDDLIPKVTDDDGGA